MGAPPSPNSIAARYLQDKSFLEMTVTARRRNGSPIQLRPGTAKYPAESVFAQISEGMWLNAYFL